MFLAYIFKLIDFAVLKQWEHLTYLGLPAAPPGGRGERNLSHKAQKRSIHLGQHFPGLAQG